MRTYFDVADDGKVDFVEVTIDKGIVVTIPDLQKVAKVFWPDTNIERVWMEPASFSRGVRLVNVDISEIRMNEKKE
ncbi:MAG: hypothetical protein Q8M83_00345 [bacterium]|nr:hypothetical protein [bacterium]